MTTTYNEISDRIKKYDGVDMFLILNKSGNVLNNENRDNDRQKGNTTNNFSDIPKLVDKAISVARNIDPLVSSIIIDILIKYYYYKRMK